MFRTELNTKSSTQKICLNQPIITVGSCFSDTIGQKLYNHKFDVLCNPFGTVFNPESIFKLIRRSIEGPKVTEQELIMNGEVYYHYDFHSDFSSTSPTQLVANINHQLSVFQEKVKNAHILILTFGTAWVYHLKERGDIVSNCHQMPADLFDRSLLSNKQILKEFESFTKLLKSFNPVLNTVLTVSPVRHTRDGLEQNQVSKATLRLATHYMQQENEQVEYFPSYELILDDLRDYRFYKKDLIHPSEEAVDYVWNKFQQTYFDEATQHFVSKWSSVLKAINHKAFHPHTQAHQNFIAKTINQLKELSKFVDISREMEQVKKQLANE